MPVNEETLNIHKGEEKQREEKAVLMKIMLYHIFDRIVEKL